MIDRRKLAAPREHLGVLIEPDAERLSAALRPDSGSGAAFEKVRILDRSLADLRAALRRRLEWTGPVVLTGHQAEFFHAGVFAKNIAAHALARQAHGTAAFLSVDSDVPKTLQLSVPQATAGGLRRVHVAIPGLDARLAMEAQPRVSREHWLEFFTRVASLWEPYYEDALLRTFANAWLSDAAPAMAASTAFSATTSLPTTAATATAASGLDFCGAMDRARAAAERALGLDGILTLRASQMCALPEFRAFAAHLVRDAERFARDYNAAQAAYRKRYRVRAAQRPVPPLALDGGRVESPFWLLDPAGARRRLSVQPQGAEVVLFADAERIGALPRAALENVAGQIEPWDMERAGWRLRPRALALSAFMRLCLADLFLHGIGGAKYDEVTEDFVRRFFGVEMPLLGCVTATLHLPLPHPNVTVAELAAARRQARDVRWNPQRYVRPAAESPGLFARREALLERARRLRDEAPRDRAARREAFAAVRQVNEAILNTDPWRAAELDQRVQTLERHWELRRIAADREYFFALHPRGELETLAQTIAARRAVQLPSRPSRDR